MKNKNVLLAVALLVVIVGGGLFFWMKKQQAAAPDAVGAAVTPPTAPGTPPSPAEGAQTQEKTMSTFDLTPDAEGLSKAVATMSMENGTVFKWRFYTNDAPETVKRITHLISTGFYNGIVFHRVIPGFVAQGGDPTGTGSGGSGTKLKAEFNARKHVHGIVSMARAQDPNSADSQFFMMLGASPHLDNQYTVFGKVVEGAEALDKIKVGDKIKTFTIE